MDFFTFNKSIKLSLLFHGGLISFWGNMTWQNFFPNWFWMFLFHCMTMLSFVASFELECSFSNLCL